MRIYIHCTGILPENAFPCSQLASSRSQLKGRDKAQLKYMQQSEDEMQEIYWSLLQHTCREIPVRDNFYLGLFLRGQRGYDPLTRPDYCPPYLTREGFSKLKVLYTTS